MGGNYEKSIYNQLMDVMARLENVEKKSEEKIAKIERDYEQKIYALNEEIKALKAENRHLKEENQMLREENARLKGIINNNSSNTSLPPSSDKNSGKRVNTYNGRKKTGNKAGGQKGHKGTTLTRKIIEEKIKSGKCSHKIKIIGNQQNRKYITRYVADVDVIMTVLEVRIYADGNGKFNIPEKYHSAVTYGPVVKSLVTVLYSEGVMPNKRIASFLNAASNGGLCLSEGSVYNFCREFSEKSRDTIEKLEDILMCQETIYTDATNVNVDKKQGYIRNFSSADTAFYHAMGSKSVKSLEKTGLLNKYTGTLVHGHETALYHFGTGHGECNVHLLRYLRKNTEETGNTWSGDMMDFLCGLNKARRQAIESGDKQFPEDAARRYRDRYMEIISYGRVQNKETKHRYAQKEEKTLLNRLEKYMDNHLLFIYDFNVAFDNNMSERDLRKVKNRQKMAGGFRKTSGQEMFCNILTIIETLKRRNMGILENIKMFFEGTPVLL